MTEPLWQQVVAVQFERGGYTVEVMENGTGPFRVWHWRLRQVGSVVKTGVEPDRWRAARAGLICAMTRYEMDVLRL